MMTFLQRAMDWVLEKEQEAAQNCHVAPHEIDEQIEMIEKKKEVLVNRYNEEMEHMEHILNRLHAIKAQSLKCSVKPSE